MLKTAVRQWANINLNTAECRQQNWRLLHTC